MRINLIFTFAIAYAAASKSLPCDEQQSTNAPVGGSSITTTICVNAVQIILHCDAIGTETRSNIAWRKRTNDGWKLIESISPSRHYKIHSYGRLDGATAGRLTIRNLTSEDAGQYRCTATEGQRKGEMLQSIRTIDCDEEILATVTDANANHSARIPLTEFVGREPRLLLGTVLKGEVKLTCSIVRFEEGKRAKQRREYVDDVSTLGNYEIIRQVTKTVRNDDSHGFDPDARCSFRYRNMSLSLGIDFSFDP